MLPSSCITTARDDCYLCAESQRTLRHHSRKNVYIDSLHVFMRHHHIRRQVYTFIICHAGKSRHDLARFKLYLIVVSKATQKKINVSNIYVYCNFTYVILPSDYKTSAIICQQIWDFADSVELHVAGGMQFQDYVNLSTIQKW